jgi:hypothetical protein
MINAIDTNQNGTIEFKEIYQFILVCIKEASKLKSLNNEEKKSFVLQKIRDILPTDVYERYNPMIDKAIDFIVFLSKHPELLKGIKNISKLCFPCCK